MTGTNFTELPTGKDAQRVRPEGTFPPELGCSHPLGATVIGGGVSFSLFSRDASGVELGRPPQLPAFFMSNFGARRET